MNSEIFLSIIIPTYNNPHELESLCNSLHHQLSKEIEVIVIDDGSTIAIKELVGKFNFKYFYKNNSGPASSRNYGANLASGRYLLFLDSDTVMPKGMFKKILSTAKEENIDICSVFYSEKSNNLGAGQQFKAYFDYFHNCYDVSEGETLSLQGSSCFFKKNVFDELGGWATEFLGATIENEEFANRIIKSGKYKIIFKPDLHVFHNFQDLKSLLKTIFRRSLIWTQLKINKMVSYDGLVRTKRKALVTMQSVLLLFFLPFSIFSHLGQFFFAICLTIYFLGNFQFYVFLFRKCSFLDLIGYIFVQYLFHLSVSAGGIIGLLIFKAHKVEH